MTRRPGHVQAYFEHTTGQRLVDWLAINGPAMTIQQAAETIGYAGPSPLARFVQANMPREFRFYERLPAVSDRDIRKALKLREAGQSWAMTAHIIGGAPGTLKAACRRYKIRSQQ